MKKNLFAYILIVIGVLTLMGNYGFIQGEFFLLIIGASFLLAYFKMNDDSKNIGFLIPGMIVTTVGLFSNIERFLFGFDGPVFLAMLGSAFLLIHYIHTRETGKTNQSKWAHYTGIGIILFSVFILAVDNLNIAPINWIFQNIFPIGLILFGIYKITRSSDKKTL